jgi:hypothetical protein
MHALPFGVQVVAAHIARVIGVGAPAMPTDTAGEIQGNHREGLDLELVIFDEIGV